MSITQTAALTISEMREFAGFTAAEQFFIERSLELARGRRPMFGQGTHRDAPPNSTPSQTPTYTRCQQAAYRELAASLRTIGTGQQMAALDGFFPALLRATALDLSRGALASFPAYRFLYERLLGAAVRPYLPAAFCAAAALPQIEPARRTDLLESVSITIVTAAGWSTREPTFIPQRLDDEAA